MEYFEGEIVVEPNRSIIHDVPGRTLVREVSEPFEAWSERGIELGPEDRPRPDAVIIRAGDWSVEMRDLPASLLLAVVEVVSTGRAGIRRDYQDKYLRYEQSGIPVYVIIDPNIGKWQLFQLGDEGRYRQADGGLFGDPIHFPAPVDLTIPTVAFHRYPAAQAE
ncbi:Uma2 family endonuclease [Streptacidiphilus sp. MAP12-20]